MHSAAISGLTPPIANLANASTLAWMDRLNDQQRNAVCYGQSVGQHWDSNPLLVIAGAGTGKTATLCHRVAWLLHVGVKPERVALLTFSRRAAHEMVRRAGELLATQHGRSMAGHVFRLPWAGTFHSVAARLLREHAREVGLNRAFTIIDRSDANDLIGWLRERHCLGGGSKRFPGAATCVAIYSDRINSGNSLTDVLSDRYPWCVDHEPALRELFSAYVERKLSDALLDYDDLLLWCEKGMQVPAFANVITRLFDHVLVDEFQDTNSLQLRILLALAPSGRGIFAVGDDAQSIYSFRAANVKHMHEFPDQFEPPAEHLTLTENYRSTQAVLDTANALMIRAKGPFNKALCAASQDKGVSPILAIVQDDAAQANYIIKQVLAQRENGVTLKNQAVLFRSSHHSDVLEMALTRSNIPFVKHGGLKFIEASHVRDYLALLRWSQNPLHHLAAFRALQLLPGFGPVFSRKCLDHVLRAASPNGVQAQPFSALSSYQPPNEAVQYWAGFSRLMQVLANDRTPLPVRLERLNQFAEPLIELRYNNSTERTADLFVLKTIASQAGSPDQFLSDMALDPPGATGAWSEDAHLDEDYLILSTVHSAKGQEWHNVYLLNVADGNFPNEYATSKPQAIEEERRLMYVAMTRAQHNLHLIEPQSYYVTHQPRLGGKHVYGARSRFLCQDVMRTLNTQCPVLVSSEQPKKPPKTENIKPSQSGYSATDLGQSPVAGAIRDLF